MRNPFTERVKRKAGGVLLDLDSRIDDAVFRAFNTGGGGWDRVEGVFRRFRVTGFPRALSELASEGLTLGLVGLVGLAVLAMPAFEQTRGDWRNSQDYAVTFLDRYGTKIGERGVRQEDTTALAELPDHFVKAVLATEDRRFFTHTGIDFLGIARAMSTNVRANGVVQGGSTITQQLAKNLFLSNERTFDRKIKEAFLSAWLESNLSKKEILKFYLDRAYMGGGNHGITAAARFYFDKEPKDLTLAESAMLAGLYKAPTKYAPHINLPNARARANEVLTNMVQAGFMTEGQVIAARRRPATPVPRNELEGPNHFIDYAFEEVQGLASRFPNHTLLVKTTVDLDLQKQAEQVIQDALRQYGKEYDFDEGAMVVFGDDGALRAMVGGVDYGESQFNRATAARRQPGSSFKPVVYAAAMEAYGYDENTPVLDGPICVRSGGKQWCPKNYTGSYGGRMTLTTALVKSYNTVPVRLYVGGSGLKGVGGKAIATLAEEMGIHSPLYLAPPMVLGSSGVTVAEMAEAYGTFMTGGLRLPKHSVLQITDPQGTVLYDARRDRPEPKRILSEPTVKAMNTILAQIPEWGTARKAALEGIRGAGKTGTTNSYVDAWYVGFTGNYVASVWFGNDDNHVTRKMTGGSVPAETWANFMRFAHRNVPLKPVPFIENPFPGRDETAVAEAAAAAPEPTRAKVLTPPMAEALKGLERALREATPINALAASAAPAGAATLTR